MSYGCNLCSLGKASNNTQIDPKGSLSPDYYIIGHTSSESEVMNNNPFDLQIKSYSYLNSVLNSLGINEINSRFNKLVRCISDNRNVTDTHRSACKDYLIKDIEDTKPKIVIGLGGEVASIILKDKFRYISTSRGRLYDVTIGSHECKFLVTYSPNYIVRTLDSYDDDDDDDSVGIENSEAADMFYRDLSYCAKFVNGELVDISSKDLRYATTYEQFKEYYDEFLVDAELPSYDIESNARLPQSSEFKIIGFSFAPNPDTGIYVVRNSLEYKMDESDWEKCVELAKSYISSRKMLVHNIMYEKPATLNEWGVEITDFEDTLIKARLLLGGKTGAGLKDQCILNLGYPEWDEDLSEYIDNFGVLWSNLYPTPSGRNRWDYLILLEQGIMSLKSTYEEYNRTYNEIMSKYSSEDEMTPEDQKALSDTTLRDKEQDNLEAIRSLEGLLANYYSQSELSDIMDLVGKELVNLIEIRYSGMLPYSSVPMRVITKYGAMDSVGTQDLNKFLTNRMNNESTPEVNLWDGYRVMKDHFVVGTSLEMNGLYWNDEVASITREWLSDVCKSSLISMLMSGYLDDLIVERGIHVLQDHVKNNMMDFVQEKLGPIVMQKTGIRIEEPVRRRVSYKNLIYELGDDFIDNHRQFILDKNKEDIMDESIHPDFNSLKYLFNPGSNSNTDILNEIFIDTDIQMGYIISRLEQMIESEDFNIESQPIPDAYLFRMIMSTNSHNQKVEDGIIDAEKITRRQLFEKVKTAIMEMTPRGSDLIQIITDAVSYKLVGTSEPVIIELYNYFVATGIDIEDESTWNDQFRFLYNFRMYKKCAKLISSYIDGNRVGRGSVWVVDKDDIESNKVMPIRKRLYDRNRKKKDTEEYLLQGNWGVCTAETLRWRCLHGDTIIPLMDGTKRKIKDLVGEREFYVYSYNYGTGQVTPGRGTNAHISYYDADTYKVTFDNGNSIICTGNHPVMLRDGRYRKVMYLNPGDSVMPLYRRETYDGYEETYNPGIDEWKRTHHLSADYKYGGGKYTGSTVIHHKTFDKKNNDPRRILRTSRHRHIKYHASKASWSVIWDDPVKREESIERSSKMMTRNNSDEEFLSRVREGQKEYWDRYYNNPTESQLRHKKIKVRSMRKCHEIRNTPEYRDMKSKEFSKTLEWLWTSDDEEAVQFRERKVKIGKSLMKELKDAQWNPDNPRYYEYEEYRKNNAKRASKLNYVRAINLAKEIYSVNGEINEDIYELNRKKGYMKWSTLVSKVGSERDLLEEICSEELPNHKVVSVEYYGKETVYDINVDTFHNFAIELEDGSGVFVHNSGVHTIPAGFSVKRIYTSRYRGGIIAAPDYSQLEIRIAAGLSNCKSLLEAFERGEDIHTRTAVGVFNKPAEDITAVERRFSKMATFRILYGSSAKGMADQFLGGDIGLAHDIIDGFYNTYPEVKEMMDKRHEEVLTLGKISCDRVGYFLFIDNDGTPGGIEDAKRKAGNYGIQSQGSMVGGYVLNSINQYCIQNGLKSKPIAFIHDSLEFDIHPDELFIVPEQVLYMMDNIPMDEFKIPTKADLTIGLSMGDENEVVYIKADDANSGVIKISGFEDSLDLLYDHWNDYYKVVEYSDDEDFEDIYIPKSDLFMPKLAISPYNGHTRRLISREFKIILK